VGRTRSWLSFRPKFILGEWQREQIKTGLEYFESYLKNESKIEECTKNGALRVFEVI
jgi:hypothetical protein